MGLAAILETALVETRTIPSFDENVINNQLSQTPLQESITETRLKALLKALPAGVIVLDGKGLVQECNPAAIELLDEPLIGLSWRSVIDRAFDHSRISGQDSVTKKGQIVSISTCPLGDGVPGQIILLQDVTEKRQLQTKYDQQKRLASMGQMAAQLAHQIRTPISAALLYASHLKSPQLDNDKRLRFADKILTRIQSLEQLINDMLLFSRNGMQNRESLPVQQLLNELEQTIVIPEDKQNVKITFAYQPSEKIFISGNRNLLISGLVNLVNNALHAVNGSTQTADGSSRTAEGSCHTADGSHKPVNEVIPEIIIKVSQPVYGAIDFSIHDNGKGIVAEDMDKIFEPFYTTRQKGTGLGLAVVKAIANAHDGELWLESSIVSMTCSSHKPLSGSIFRMRIPTQIQSLINNSSSHLENSK